MTVQLLDLARYATLTLAHHLRNCTKVGVTKTPLPYSSQQASKTFLSSRGGSNSSFGGGGLRTYSTTIGRTEADKVSKKERKAKAKKTPGAKKTSGSEQAMHSKETKKTKGKNKIFLEPNETRLDTLPEKETRVKSQPATNNMASVALGKNSSPSRNDIKTNKPKAPDVNTSAMNVGLNAINTNDVKHKNILGFDSKNKILDMYNRPLPRHPYLNSQRLTVSPNGIKLREEINRFFKSPKQEKNMVNVLESDLKDTYGLSFAKQHPTKNAAQKIDRVSPGKMDGTARSQSRTPKHFREALEALERDTVAMNKAFAEEEIRSTTEKLKNIYRSLPKKKEVFWQRNPSEPLQEVLPGNVRDEPTLVDRHACISPFTGMNSNIYTAGTSNTAPRNVKDNTDTKNMDILHGKHSKQFILVDDTPEIRTSGLNQKSVNLSGKSCNSGTFILVDEETTGSEIAAREKTSRFNASSEKETSAPIKKRRSQTFIVEEGTSVDEPRTGHHYVKMTVSPRDPQNTSLSVEKITPVIHRRSVLDKKGPHDSKYFTRPNIDENDTKRDTSSVTSYTYKPTGGEKSSTRVATLESEPAVNDRAHTKNGTSGAKTAKKNYLSAANYYKPDEMYNQKLASNAWTNLLNRETKTSTHSTVNKNTQVGLNLLRIPLSSKPSAQKGDNIPSIIEDGGKREENDTLSHRSNPSVLMRNDTKKTFQEKINEFKQKALERATLRIGPSPQVNGVEGKANLTASGPKMKNTLKRNKSHNGRKSQLLTYNALLNEYEETTAAKPKSKKEKHKADKKKVYERYAYIPQPPAINKLVKPYGGASTTITTTKSEELKSPSACSSISSVPDTGSLHPLLDEEQERPGAKGDNSQQSTSSTHGLMSKTDEIEQLKRRASHYSDIVETLAGSSLRKRKPESEKQQGSSMPVSPVSSVSRDGHTNPESKGGEGEGDYLTRLEAMDAGLPQINTTVQKLRQLGPLDGWMGMTLIPVEYNNKEKKSNREIPDLENCQDIFDDIKKILKKGDSLRSNARDDALTVARRDLITAYKKNIRRHQQALDRYQGKLKKIEDEQRTLLKTSARAGRAF